MDYIGALMFYMYKVDESRKSRKISKTQPIAEIIASLKSKLCSLLRNYVCKMKNVLIFKLALYFSQTLHQYIWNYDI